MENVSNLFIPVQFTSFEIPLRDQAVFSVLKYMILSNMYE